MLDSNEYGTLDIELMLSNYDKNEVMTLKEMTVLIRNIINYGFILNAYWLQCADKALIIERALRQIDIASYRLNSGGLSIARQKNSIIMYLKTKGITLEKVDAETISAEEKAINKFLESL